MALAPIWKDYFVTLGNGDYYDYEIRKDSTSGAVLYSGRAYKRPGADSVQVRINDVVADYLREQLPALVNSGFTSFALALTVCVAVSGTAKATETFYNDWSYDPTFNPATMPLSDPVRATLDPRQRLIFSTLPASSLTATLTFRDGTTAQVIDQIARSADFNNDFNADFSQTATNPQGGAAILDLSQFTGLASVSIGGQTWAVLDNACHKYAVYYVNAYGGWDSLLLDGSTTRRDALARHTTKMDYDNRQQTARGTKDYAIEVSPAWILRTGILTDEESGRMHHLLNSQDVYLCDLSTGAMHPVVLTDDETPHKSYEGNGRTLNQYTFNATLAQQRLRR